MAKSLRKPSRVVRSSSEPIKPQGMVVSDIVVRSVDRSPKDVGKWRAAHITAESVHYPNRTKLYDLYADVMLDGHLSGIIYNKRIATVRNKKLRFTRNGKKVDEMDTLLASMAFRNLKTTILETPAFGISGVEFKPGERFEFEVIPRKHIKPEFGIITNEQSDFAGVAYEAIDNILIIGEKYDLGYLLSCAFYALIKKGDFSDWAQFVEIFGQPIRVIKYDAYDNKTKIELKQVLDESGSSLALMIPKQADFDIKDGKGSNGDGQLQERLKNACNEEMSVRVLGVTETTTSSKSSGYAQSQTHQQQQGEVVADDMDYLLQYLNTDKFLAILKSYGYPVAGGKFEYEQELNLTVLKERKEIDLAISKKVPISDDYWYETYGIPKPDNYEELKKQMQTERQNDPDPDTDDEETKPAKGTGKPVVKQLNAWRQFRTMLADFFDPAP